MKVGLVGWRGMVGSVLMQRMVEENDFAHFEPFYFSTSNAGGEAPSFGGKTAPALMDASDIKSLKQMDVIITCQGGDYTSEVFQNSKLKAGMAIGLMPHQHYVWQMMPSSYLIQ
jgi:aspartate-semialdehyde dehydrogenase